MDLEVTRTRRPARCLAIRSRRGDFAAIPETLREIYGWLAQHGLQPSGPPGMRCLQDPAEVGVEACDWEAFVELPADTRGTGDERVELRHEPAVEIATTLHVGPYATLDTTYHALGRWTEAHGLRWVGPPEELYLSPPEVPEDQARTQVRVAIVEPS